LGEGAEPHLRIAGKLAISGKQFASQWGLACRENAIFWGAEIRRFLREVIRFPKQCVKQGERMALFWEI
jgi:hypothetical protein